MEILDHLTCLLRNLYAGQEARLRTGHGSKRWFQIRKGVHQVCTLSPCLFDLYAKYIMRNAGRDEAQHGIKIAGKNIKNIRYEDTTLMPESKKELFQWKRRVKSWLKSQHSENWDHDIWFHHFMANRWVNSGNSDWLYFWELQNQCRWWLQPRI